MALEAPDASLKTLIGHFQSIIKVLGPNNDSLIMRFADPRVVARFAASFTTAQCLRMLGPVQRLRGHCHGGAWELAQHQTPETTGFDSSLSLTHDNIEVAAQLRHDALIRQLADQHETSRGLFAHWWKQVESTEPPTEKPIADTCARVAQAGLAQALTATQLKPLANTALPWRHRLKKFIAALATGTG